MVGKSKPLDGKKKQPKIRLTKEQKLHVAQLIQIENRIALCREYIELWSKFFHFFSEDLAGRPISPEEEKGFFQMMSALARKHFLFTELMAETFSGSGAVLEILIKAVSLSNLKSLDDSSLSKLELDWHTQFLQMNVALGRLLRRLPPGTDIDALLGRSVDSAKGSKDATGAKAAKKGKEAKKEESES